MSKIFTKKNIIISIATIIIIVAAVIIINIIQTNNYNSTHSAFLDLNIKPEDTIVVLDGETINTNSGIVRITPGKHSLAILRAGFFPDGEEFSIEEGEYHDAIFVLMPYTEEAQKIFDEIEEY